MTEEHRAAQKRLDARIDDLEKVHDERYPALFAIRGTARAVIAASREEREEREADAE